MTNHLPFFRPTPYSAETKQQIWSTIITDAHDLHCGCTEPISHLINDLIPPDHPDRHLTIDQLVRKNFRRQICLFGGKEEKGGGGADEDPTTKEHTKPLEEGEEELTEQNIEELIAVADAAEER